MTNSRLRLAFAGTPALAQTVMESIIVEDKHQINLVLTQPDRPAGRGRKIRQSEVKLCALKHELPVFQPASSSELDELNFNDYDLMLVVAYGLIIKPMVLSSFKFGCINIHTSLLPRWRGAAPIQRAIEAGDQESGISFMQMDIGLDTGPIIEQIITPIHADDTGGNLHDRLATISAEKINTVLDEIANQQITTTKQDNSKATYANKISKQEATLDWTQTAKQLQQKIRAFNPFPVTHTVLNGMTMRVWEAEVKDMKLKYSPGTLLENKKGIEVCTGEDALILTKIQLAGKRVMSAAEFLNGHPDFYTHSD